MVNHFNAVDEDKMLVDDVLLPVIENLVVESVVLLLLLKCFSLFFIHGWLISFIPITFD
jgi:hypothetical protein